MFSSVFLKKAKVEVVHEDDGTKTAIVFLPDGKRVVGKVLPDDANLTVALREYRMTNVFKKA